MYVAADTLEDEGAQLKSGIWKHKINEDGSLQDGILVYDWDESPYGNVAQIYDITFSADGHLFIASDNQNPLIILDATGNTEILYSNSFVDPVDKICWGTGKYMYVNIMSDDEEKSGVFRVVMGKEGAPYYGRQ